MQGPLEIARMRRLLASLRGAQSSVADAMSFYRSCHRNAASGAEKRDAELAYVRADDAVAAVRRVAADVSARIDQAVFQARGVGARLDVRG